MKVDEQKFEKVKVRLNALARSHALEILDYIDGEGSRFNDIVNNLEKNPNSVSRGLNILSEAELVDKDEDTKQYKATSQGKEALDLVWKLGNLELREALEDSDNR